MKLTVMQLRQVIRNVLTEMKLGVASPNPPGAHFRGPEEEPVEQHTSDVEELSNFLRRAKAPFRPSAKAVAAEKRRHASEKPDNRDW